MSDTSITAQEVGLLADVGEDQAWIRTRKTGLTWLVHGTPLERALTYPEEYEILEPDDFGNFCGEDGEIVIAAPTPPPPPPAPEPAPAKRQTKAKAKAATEYVDEDDDF